MLRTLASIAATNTPEHKLMCQLMIFNKVVVYFSSKISGKIIFRIFDISALISFIFNSKQARNH